MSAPPIYQPTIYGEPPPVGMVTFLRERRTGVGGSDAAAILGVSPWASALGAWESKRGMVVDTEGTERMVWGNRLEHAVRTGYNTDYGTHYLKPRKMLRHERWPFVIGHLDGLEGKRVLEVKTADYKTPAWGDEGSDDIPAVYYAQVQHYLMVVGGEVSDVAVLFGGNRLERYEVPAHREFQEALLDDEARFWQQVVTGEPPPPDGTPDAAAALRRLYPSALDEAIVATPEVAGYAAAFQSARDKEAIAKREKDHAAQLMQQAMGERRKLTGAGFTATWGNTAGKTSWKDAAAHLTGARDTAEIEQRLAELADEFRGEPSRTFRFTAK